jgi:hypothetical protein
MFLAFQPLLKSRSYVALAYTLLLLFGLKTINKQKHSDGEHPKPDDKAGNEPRPVITIPRSPVAIGLEAKTEERQTVGKILFRLLEIAGIAAVIVYTIFTYQLWQNTNETLKQTTEQFRLDQRAWVGLDSIAPKKSIDRQGRQTFSLSLIFKNMGKTPALKTTIETQTGGLLRGEALPTWGEWDKIKTETQQKLDEIATRTKSPIPIVLVEPNETLAPGATREMTMTVDAAALKLLNAGTPYLLVRVTYNDIFAPQIHTSTMCFTYEGLELNPCLMGNTRMD